MMIVIVDYNIGNVKSLKNNIENLGMQVIISRDKKEIGKADGIILPGVGTFKVAMDNLKKYSLIDVLKEQKSKGKPILGICLGMQILFETGYEIEKTEGLGFFKGTVSKILTNEKLPHMGWNNLKYINNSDIINGINENEDVYFVHSYMANCEEKDIIAYSEYGNVKIPAICQNNNIIGCQFHPEKSGTIGKQILINWKEMLSK